jgi:hypothetical protein
MGGEGGRGRGVRVRNRWGVGGCGCGRPTPRWAEMGQHGRDIVGHGEGHAR